MSKINPDFTDELKKYGAHDLHACYNCGTCTAVCSLSTEENSFPREMVRYSVLGIESDIQSSLKPWLCYYCGECSESCPRRANPGELMMSLRRWLMAKYDWTRLSGLFFKSLTATIIAFILVAFAVIAVGFKTEFNTEKMLHFGHYFEIFAIAGVFALIILPNVFLMFWHTILKQKLKIPFKLYFISFKELIIHMFTQKRALQCEDGNKFRWTEHFILVIGYLSLLFITVVLDWFGTENMIIIVSGYVMSAIIFVVTIHFVADRIQKKKELSKFSHPSDWFFVIWLFLMGLTAFVVRLFIDIDLLENNLWVFIFHLIILAQWALIIVPFGKWTHFIYRSFAMYFDNIIERNVT